MNIIYNCLLILVFTFLGPNMWAQSSNASALVSDQINKSKHTLYGEYLDFLALPNTVNDREGLLKNANYIADMMKHSAISNVRLLYADTEGVPPAVYGEYLVPGAKTTLIFYAHYDGQPVNPEKWHQGLSPFKPQTYTDRIDRGGAPVANLDVLADEYRLYARAAADDKAGVFAIINGIRLLRQSGQSPHANIKFFFEGQEELGSTHLHEILSKHKTLLLADLWVISDGPMHASGKKQVTFGVRGDVNMHLTVYGPARPLHSGNYGNWAPNPANKLVRLLASMKDDRGFVTIKGFYDDVIPLSDVEKSALKNIPDVSESMRHELAFAKSEMNGISFLEGITSLPTLNINGMAAANVGKLASNIIPTTASVALDLRLVKGNDAKRQIQKVIDHIKEQGYHVVTNEPTPEDRLQYPNIIFVNASEGYNAQRTPMDHPIAAKVISNLKNYFSGEDIILMPSAGGSLPLYLFEDLMQTPPITIPVVNNDNNQHGENENVRLGHLFQGISIMAAVMVGHY